LTSGRYASRDYDYTRPRADLTVARKDPRPTGQNTAEVYQYHDATAGSHYAQPKAGTKEANDPFEEGRDFALRRMQALRSPGARANASGHLRGMVPGCSFVLQGHPRRDANAEYLVLDTRFVIEDVAQTSQIKDAAALRKQSWRIEVDFTAHPMAEPLRPALIQPKPHIGPQWAGSSCSSTGTGWARRTSTAAAGCAWARRGPATSSARCTYRASVRR
jgi:type VI secretion system secreted protein VgrG